MLSHVIQFGGTSFLLGGALGFVAGAWMTATKAKRDWRSLAFAYAILVIGLLMFALPAFAQQPPRPSDPATIQMQLEETQFLLAQRRDQVAKAEKAIEQMASERDYWAAYAGFPKPEAKK